MLWVPRELPQSSFVLWWPKGPLLTAGNKVAWFALHPMEGLQLMNHVAYWDLGAAMRNCCQLSRARAKSSEFFSAACFAFPACVMSKSHRSASDGHEHP